jgi:1,4-alpha-glucan branching enzyme
MHDSLRYLDRDPVHRRYHHDELTFRGLYAYAEKYVLPLSHDEVVHGKRSLLAKMPGDKWRRFANLRFLYGLMWTQPGKKLLFMGGELAVPTEWNHDANLDWSLHDQPGHDGVRRLIADLNRLYRSEPALHVGDADPAGFKWVVVNDDVHSVYAWLRLDPANIARPVLVVVNATPSVHYGYRVGVPRAEPWEELLNSDAEFYNGSGVGNLGTVEPTVEPWHGFDQSIPVTVPPLSIVLLAPV